MLILSVAIAFLTLGALWFAAVLNEHDMHPMRRLAELMKRPALEVALVALVAIGLIHHGATKGVRSGDGNAPELDAGTWTVPDDAVEELRSGLPPTVPCAAYGGTNDLSSVTNLCFAEIAVASDSVLVSVAWPTNWALPLSTLLLYARHDLASGGWERVASAVAPEGVNAVDVEMPFAILPDGGSNRTFFAAGTLYDSDGDGLSDSDERLIYGTDPNSSDTDSDLVSDGDEVARGTDPLSGDTDGDGIDDCHESGGFTRDPIPDTFSTWSVVADLTAQMLANTQMCVDVALQLPAAVLDESFSRIAVDPNGIVVLHNGGEMSLAARPQCQDMRYAQFPSNTFAIAGYWAGLSLSTNEPASSVRLLAGPSPIVEYSNMRLASAASPEVNLVSFQIWLPVAGIPFGTLFYQMSGAETDGRRASVGMCGRNGAFRASYCCCNPGRMADGMVLYADPGYGTDPLNPDSDADGIGDGAELDLGTDPTQPDTDGDGMPDGWEQDHGFDPCTHNSQTATPDDDFSADPDGDGLANGSECEWGTDPQVADTDGDGVNDGAEVGQNSDPADATDLGAPNSRVAVPFYFGDQSGSHSEKYILDVKPEPGSGEGAPPRAYSWMNTWYGQCETKTAMLKPGWRYEVRMQWASCKCPNDGVYYPNYDYTLVLGQDVPSNVVLDDPGNLFRSNYYGIAYYGAAHFPILDAVANISVCKFTVDEILFNHNGSSCTSDGMNLLKRYAAGMQVGIENGEWREGGSVNDPVCYAGGTAPTVKARFKVSPSLASARLSADSVGSGSPLGGLSAHDVTFSDGISSWVEFSSVSMIPCAVRKADHRWEWKVSGIGGNDVTAFICATTGPHRVYTVLGELYAPWDANADNLPSTPRADALDFACSIAQGATTEHAVLSALTSHFFYNMGFSYDTVEGGSQYWQGNKFNASSYIAGQYVKVNCADQTYAVVTFGNLLGACATPVSTQRFGFINPMNIVGVGVCNNPFYEGEPYGVRRVTTNGVASLQILPVPQQPVCDTNYVGRSLFGVHTYAMANGVIFDACVGPVLGTQTHNEYLNSTIDHSTADEEWYGFFSDELPGSSMERSRSFQTE